MGDRPGEGGVPKLLLTLTLTLIWTEEGILLLTLTAISCEIESKLEPFTHTEKEESTVKC